MSRVYYKNAIGFSLIELLLAIMLLGIIFLAVSALYTASQKTYFTTSEKLILSAELQYAMKHIYNNAMRGIGDKNTHPFQVYKNELPDLSGDRVDIRIHSDPLTSSNYNTIATYSYYKSVNTLMFDNGITPLESLVPKVIVEAVTFANNPSSDDNVLTISIRGTYKTQTLTLYSSCYPRLASFH